jgi:hypothetical protein
MRTAATARGSDVTFVEGTDPKRTLTRCPGPPGGQRCGWKGWAADARCPPEGGVVTCPRCGTAVETMGVSECPAGSTTTN